MRSRLLNPLAWTIRVPRIQRRTVTDWLFWYLIGLLFVSLLPVFFWVVAPSLTGKSDLRIGADSSLYLWYAGMGSDPGLLRHQYDIEGSYQGELTIPRLFAFGSNLIGPVLVAKILQSNFRIMLFNYTLFFISMHYLFEPEGVNRKLLIVLLLLNPVTMVSLLTLNKEIFALLATALLVRHLETGRRSRLLLILILFVSLLARWEMTALTIGFLFLVRWRWTNRHRVLAMMAIIVAISVLYPVIPKEATPALLSAASIDAGGRVMAIMNGMQDHFLFFIAVWPKMFVNISGILFHPSHFSELDWTDLQNSVFEIWSGAAAVAVTIALFLRNRVRLSSDFIYYAVLLLILISITSFAQYRYAYPAYIFGCLELATRRREEVGGLMRRSVIRRRLIGNGLVHPRADS